VNTRCIPLFRGQKLPGIFKEEAIEQEGQVSPKCEFPKMSNELNELDLNLDLNLHLSAERASELSN
jgi:hypothetical protein